MGVIKRDLIKGEQKESWRDKKRRMHPLKQKPKEKKGLLDVSVDSVDCSLPRPTINKLI